MFRKQREDIKEEENFSRGSKSAKSEKNNSKNEEENLIENNPQGNFENENENEENNNNNIALQENLDEALGKEMESKEIN